MKKILMSFLIVIGLFSCDNFNKIDDSVFVTIVAGNRSITPAGFDTYTDTKKYTISGSSSKGNSFTDLDLGATITIQLELSVDDWTLTLKEYNTNDELIAQGSVNVTLTKGSNPTLTIPMSYVSGKGDFNLVLNWYEVDSPKIDIVLTNKETAVVTSDTISTLTKSDTSTSKVFNLDSGIYDLEVKLYTDGDLLSINSDVVYIIKEKQTTGNLTLGFNLQYFSGSDYRFILEKTTDVDGLFPNDRFFFEVFNDKSSFYTYNTEGDKTLLIAQEEIVYNHIYDTGQSNKVYNFTYNSGSYKDWVLKLEYADTKSGSFTFTNTSSQSIEGTFKTTYYDSDILNIDINGKYSILDFNNYDGNMPLYVQQLVDNNQYLYSLAPAEGSIPEEDFEAMDGGNLVNISYDNPTKSLNIDNLGNDKLDLSFKYLSSNRGVFGYNKNGEDKVGFFNLDITDTNQLRELGQYNEFTWNYEEFSAGQADPNGNLDPDSTLFANNKLFTFKTEFLSGKYQLSINDMYNMASADFPTDIEYLGQNNVGEDVFKVYGDYDFLDQLDPDFARNIFNQYHSVIFIHNSNDQILKVYNNASVTMENVLSGTNPEFEFPLAPNLHNWWINKEVNGVKYPYLSYEVIGPSSGYILDPTDASKSKLYPAGSIAEEKAVLKSVTPSRAFPLTIVTVDSVDSRYTKTYFPDESGRGVYETYSGSTIIATGVAKLVSNDDYTSNFEVVSVLDGSITEKGNTFNFQDLIIDFDIPASLQNGGRGTTGCLYYDEVNTALTLNSGEHVNNYIRYNIFSNAGNRMIISTNGINMLGNVKWIVYDTTDENNPKLLFGNNIISYLENNFNSFEKVDYNVAASSTKVYSVGEIGPANGIVFYSNLDQEPGERFYEVSNTTVFSANSWIEPGSVYANKYINDPDRLYDGFGLGESNSKDIANKAVNSFADDCEGLVENGYNDWFLPSIDEIVAINGSEVFSFGADTYVSSTEHSKDFSVAAVYRNTTIDYIGKTETADMQAKPLKAIPIRRF